LHRSYAGLFFSSIRQSYFAATLVNLGSILAALDYADSRKLLNNS